MIFVLSAMGLVNPRMLLNQWRLAIIIIAVVSAMITPTIDPVNMALVMAPMIVLYFFSIVMSSMAQAGRKKQAKDESIIRREALAEPSQSRVGEGMANKLLHVRKEIPVAASLLVAVCLSSCGLSYAGSGHTASSGGYSHCDPCAYG